MAVEDLDVIAALDAGDEVAVDAEDYLDDAEDLDDGVPVEHTGDEKVTAQKHLADRIAARFRTLSKGFDLEVVVCDMRRTEPLERSSAI